MDGSFVILCLYYFVLIKICFLKINAYLFVRSKKLVINVNVEKKRIKKYILL